MINVLIISNYKISKWIKISKIIKDLLRRTLGHLLSSEDALNVLRMTWAFKSFLNVHDQKQNVGFTFFRNLRAHGDTTEFLSIKFHKKYRILKQRKSLPIFLTNPRLKGSSRNFHKNPRLKIIKKYSIKDERQLSTIFLKIRLFLYNFDYGVADTILKNMLKIYDYRPDPILRNLFKSPRLNLRLCQ